MTREEKNRLIAESFEAKPTRPGTDYVSDVDYSPLKAWCYSRHFTGDSWRPRSFYSDEAANAMVLEAMPEPELWVESMKGESKMWACVPNLMQEGPDKNPHYVLKMDADRKTAICEAFIAWKEKSNG